MNLEKLDRAIEQYEKAKIQLNAFGVQSGIELPLLKSYRECVLALEESLYGVKSAEECVNVSQNALQSAATLIDQLREKEL